MLCSPDNDTACADRREAEHAGRFVWDADAGCWFFKGRGGAYTMCPFCLGELPDLNNPEDDGELYAPVVAERDRGLPPGFGFDDEQGGDDD